MQQALPIYVCKIQDYDMTHNKVMMKTITSDQKKHSMQKKRVEKIKEKK